MFSQLHEDREHASDDFWEEDEGATVNVKK